MVKYFDYKLVLLVLLFGLFISCLKKDPVLTNDKTDFELKREAFEPIFPVYFNKLDHETLTEDEHKYLEYLFTYMPISDFADYSFDFWLRSVKYSILAKNTFSWSDSIPEEIFMHYVLPPRINNENLDTARMVFYRELKVRFEGENLTAEEAVLEINHWCNEKVIYTGTDERTISPLGIVRSGFGRCGEESTFLTTALRSVGIPARQVYTPRWVHTDDNHAWVEVWINGEWKYLGACEPAPVLNTGWFDVPATRAMLVHTKQFGKETIDASKVLSENKNYDWINALKGYAPTKNIRVKVVDENNLPVWGAKVRYQVYNYAELYTLFEDETGSTGLSEFTTGIGSVQVSVSEGNKCSNLIVDPEQKDLVTIVLGSSNDYPDENCKYLPPVAGDVVVLTEEQLRDTEKRIKQNEVIRNNSHKDFYNEYTAKHFAKTFGYGDEVSPFLIKSKGNWPEIEKFLIEASFMSNQKIAIELLNQISQKDLRDTKSDILSEHLNYSLQSKNPEIEDNVFNNYVLNPRVEFEMLKCYREQILSGLNADQVSDLKQNPEKVVNYIVENISTDIHYGDLNYAAKDFNKYNVALTPYAVDKFKIADEKSLKIYFVAFCRSLGIPARIDFASGFAQFYHQDTWYDAKLNDNLENVVRGKVNFITEDSLRNPKYRINFSIAIFENGEFNTIDLGWEKSIASFPDGVDVPVGKYMLLTSLRLDDGSVLVNRDYFDLSENEIIDLNIKLPIEEVSIEEEVKFEHGNIVSASGDYVNTKKLYGGNNNLVLIWLQKNSEPSKHILQDLNLMYEEIHRNGISLVYITDGSWTPEKQIENRNVQFYTDTDFQLLFKNKTCMISGAGTEFPQIYMINNESKIVYNSSGYIINAGEFLLQGAY